MMVFIFQVIIEDMLKNVVRKYVNMGGCQYLRDYRMAQRLKKTAELRKRVMERNKKHTMKSDSIPFQEILNDRSPGKSVSNGRLIGFLQKHKFNGLVGVYTKPQLLKLCQAYGVSQVSRLNKTNLAQRLAAVILSNNGFSVPAAVDSRHSSQSGKVYLKSNFN